jgi:hypothetical protein
VGYIAISKFYLRDFVGVIFIDEVWDFVFGKKGVEWNNCRLFILRVVVGGR